VGVRASDGEMSRRSGDAAEADNHSDISPFKWHQPFIGWRRYAQPQIATCRCEWEQCSGVLEFATFR